MDDERNEVERLLEALRINQPLATAYYMKEDLGRIWRQADKESAAFLLDDWIKRAVVSGIGMLVRFAKTLSAHRDGILAYYDFDKISTGPLEGMNDRTDAAESLWFFGHRVLQAEDHGPARNHTGPDRVTPMSTALSPPQVRFSRKSLNFSPPPTEKQA